MSKEKGRKLKSAWSVTGLSIRFREIVLDGTYKKLGRKGAIELLTSEFGEPIKDSGCRLTVSSLDKKAKPIIWTRQRQNSIRDAIKDGLSREEVYPRFDWVPERLFYEKWRQIRKTAQGQRFVPGINRLDLSSLGPEAQSFELPLRTFDEPLVVPNFKPGDSVAVLNGNSLGIAYPENPGDNPAIQALEDIAKTGDKAVVLTNFLLFDVKKAAGPMKVHRALCSGRDLNPDVLSRHYQDEARSIMKKLPKNQLIYVTLAELFADSMNGLEKIFTDKGRSRTGNKPVLVNLGFHDEAFIAAATYWEARFLTLQRQARARRELQLADRSLRDAQDVLRRAENRGASEGELREIRERLNFEEKERAHEEALEMNARITITAINDQELQRFYRQTLAAVVRMIEDAIPNSKVIGMGSSYLQLGDSKIELYVPNHDRPTDTLLADFNEHKAGPMVRKGVMPDMVVITHPNAICHRETIRENDAGARRGHAHIVVAPMLVNRKFLRKKWNQIIRSANPKHKAVFNEQTETGLVRIREINGELHTEFVKDTALDVTNSRRRRKHGNGRYPCDYIWIEFNTDQHSESRNRAQLWVPWRERLMAPGSIVAEAMRRDGLFKPGNGRVHMWCSNDDILQANHFGGQRQPHPHELPYSECEKHFVNIERQVRKAEDLKVAKSLVSELRALGLYQIQRRGSDWTQRQAQEHLRRFIEPNIDQFLSILDTAQRAKLKLKGISEYYSEFSEVVVADTRDPGLINMGTGNHTAKTTNLEMLEGWIFAEVLIPRLLAEPKWRGKEQILRKLVRAPLYSNRFISWGTIQAPSGYVYGLDLRDTPTKLQTWSDTLLGWIRNYDTRGNFSRIFDRFTLSAAGDKHFANFGLTPNTLFHMGPPETETDQYGEYGFAPNNTGVSFIGLPVNGTDSGPILMRLFLFDWLERWVENPISLDWNEILPNPA